MRAFMSNCCNSFRVFRVVDKIDSVVVWLNLVGVYTYHILFISLAVPSVQILSFPCSFASCVVVSYLSL